MDLNRIPKDVQDEIRFMLGSIEECHSEYLKPILERHGYYPPQDYFVGIEPVDDPALVLDIYNTLFSERELKEQFDKAMLLSKVTKSLNLLDESIDHSLEEIAFGNYDLISNNPQELLEQICDMIIAISE